MKKKFPINLSSAPHRLVFFLSAVLLLNGFKVFFSSFSSEQIKAELKTELLDDLKRIEQQLQQTKELIKRQPAARFRALNSISKYPVSVISSKGNYYWSDHHYLPDANLISKPGFTVVSQRNHRFILRYDTLNTGTELYKIAITLSLFKKYGIINEYLNPSNRYTVLSQVQLTAADEAAADSVIIGNGYPVIKYNLKTDSRPYKPANLFNIINLMLYLLVAINLWQVLKERLKRYQNQYSLQWVAIHGGVLTAIAGLMTLLDFPDAIINLAWFNTRYFSWLTGNISLGTGIVIALLLSVFIIESRACLNHHISKLKAKGSLSSQGFIVLVLVVNLLALALSKVLIFKLLNVELTAPTALGILNLSSIKIGALIFIASLGLVVFLLNHIAISAYDKLSPDGIWQQLSIFIATTALFSALQWLIFRELDPFYYLAAFTIWLLISRSLMLHKAFNENKIQGYIYPVFTVILVCSIVFQAKRESLKTDLVETKRTFGALLASENDPLAELMIYNAGKKIKTDPFITERMINPMADRAVLLRKIHQLFKDPHFDRYDIKVNLFNSGSQALSINEFELSQTSLNNWIVKNQPKSPYPDLYRYTNLNQGIFIGYYCKIDLKDSADVYGSVVINLAQKRAVPGTVFPELLVEKRSVQLYQKRAYSFAVYNKDSLINNQGNFNYDRDIDAKLKQLISTRPEGIYLNGYHHLAVSKSKDISLIISSEEYSLKTIFADVAFIFLTLLPWVFLRLLIVFVMRRGNLKNLSFSARLQIYLNAAFIFPMLLMSVLAINVMRDSYRSDLYNNYRKTTEDLANLLNPILEKSRKNEITEDELAAGFKNIALSNNLDINLYQRGGNLKLTSQPLIFRGEILSLYLNPEAIAILVEGKQNSTLLSENIGKLNYKAAYVAIRSFEDAYLLGFISIPFFESNLELKHQLNDVISTLLILFAILLVVFLFLSWYLSEQFTAPLRLITQRLKRTKLGNNQPLTYLRTDEVGLLVAEYNNMLSKLEASRQALSKTEKESAWREMAKQVAHEIKNPLTPMKLSLQYLLMQLKRNQSEDRSTVNSVEKSVNTLLVQIENLSEIADSFSSFATMPLPARGVFVINQVIEETAALYEAKAQIITRISPQPLEVNIDKKLFSRILTNLIINGIQAVEESKEPTIEISLSLVEGTWVSVSVKDNGNGVSPENRDKIFLPNFSTKTGGAGIGLAMAKRGIEQMDGQISFETSPETGTVFTIKFPLFINKPESIGSGN